MPRLHKYLEKQGYYVKTSIDEKIVTFQLTPNGINRLLKAGIGDGDRFRRAFLFDLWRQCDAFIHGSGPGEIVTRDEREGQLELDFSDDPESDVIFSGCAGCGSLDDLHIIEIKKAPSAEAGLMCPRCRTMNKSAIDSSLPISIVDRGVFLKFLEMRKIQLMDNHASAFGQSLEKAFSEKWDILARERVHASRETQESLFDDDKQKKLI